MLIDKKCLLFSLFQLLNVREQEEYNHARVCDVISCTWVRNNVLMCLPAANKGWEWDIDFLHAVVGPGLSKKRHKQDWHDIYR